MIGNLKKLLHEKNVSSLISNISVAFLGLVSFMFLTRQLPSDQFGDWVLFITMATFVDAIRFGLTRTSVVRLLAGAAKSEYKRLLGSSFTLNFILFVLTSVCCFAILWIVLYVDYEISNGYILFLKWYPLLGLSGLGWKNASALFQAEQNFTRMMYVRFANVGLFVTFLVVNGFFLKWGITAIVIVNIVVNFISSFWCTIKKWDGLAFVFKSDRKTQLELFHFGKYSMGTLVGSNLLKSADTIIIGLSPFLGSTAIAMYAIPLKLTDLLGIPLRSFGMTAYPRMSKKFMSGDIEGLRNTFYSYSGAVTVLFVPIALGCFFFAKELILLLGGETYLFAIDELVLIFRIFTLYTLLLPIDRFIGVLFDSINKPNLNLYKVLIMVVLNIVINCIAVFWYRSLSMVAWGTVLFTLLGIVVGMHLLKTQLSIRPRALLGQSLYFFKNLKSFLPS